MCTQFTLISIHITVILYTHSILTTEVFASVMLLQFCKIPIELLSLSHRVTNSAQLMLFVAMQSCCLFIILPYITEWTEYMASESRLFQTTPSVLRQGLWTISSVFVPKLMVVVQASSTEHGSVLSLEMSNKFFSSRKLTLTFFTFCSQ